MKRTSTESASTPIPAPLMTTEEAAGWLGVQPYTMRRWRSEGRGPRWVRVGRLSRYRFDDLTAWAEAQAVTPGRRGRV